jgi:hypothetical protein
VISISWGFSKDHPRIKNALSKAHSKNIVILAAAANHGRLDQIAFPARSSKYVICIGAARGDGRATGFTAEDPEFQSFMAPGNGVLGASVRRTWLGGYTTERKDGTSSATPIAAGVAALFIEYMRRTDRYEVASRQNIFKLFSDTSADFGETYRLLCPWTLDEEKVVRALNTPERKNRTQLGEIKRSLSHHLVILMIDTNSGVEVLLVNMNSIVRSSYLLTSQRKGKKNCLNGFTPAMNILADGMGQLSKDEPKTQEHGSERNSKTGLRMIQICCFFVQEKVSLTFIYAYAMQLEPGNHF